MNNQTTEQLKRIKAKRSLGLPLTAPEKALQTLYGQPELTATEVITPADNVEIIGYYIETGKTELHFRKSHVKNIRLAEAAEITEAAQGNEQLNALIGKSVFIEFNNGAAVFGFLHQTIVSARNNKNYLVRYYVEMPTRRVYFESADIKTIREY